MKDLDIEGCGIGVIWLLFVGYGPEVTLTFRGTCARFLAAVGIIQVAGTSVGGCWVSDLGQVGS